LLVLLVAAVAIAVTYGSTVLASPHPSPKKKPPLSTLKLLQFNVLSAAQGRDAGVAAVIKESGADVVTLDEVAYKDIFDKIVARTGFHSVWVKSLDPYSVGILSRYPIRHCTPYVEPPMHHAAYSCEITIHGVRWWIFGAHLYPGGSEGDEQTRAQEAAFLLAKMKALAPANVVLAGDLNSQTPGENEETPLLVIPLIKAAKYVDSYRELYTVQQNTGFTITPPPWGNWERRIDYVFHSRNVRAVAARVISSVSGYSWPSDHAALYVRLINRPTVVTARR
jgi:endonuclease/exonuclease/phosphatase family metal-dependent hydrolase